jgi:hypothetical protein
MSNWRDSQKQAQKEQNVKLKKDTSVDVRFTGDENNRVPSIVKTELVGEEYIDTIFETLSGLYVGSFLVIEAYHEGEKRKYQTSPYFDKQNIVWINDKGKSFGAEQFTVEEAKAILKKKGCNVGTKSVVVLATEKGIFTVKTNSTLWINQFSPFEWSGVSKDYFLEFSAIIFNPKDVMFSKVSPEYYANMTDGRYPTCVKVVQGKYVTDEIAKKINAQEAYENFIEYRDSIKRIVKSQNQQNKPQANMPQQFVTPAPIALPTSTGGEDLPF